MVGNEFGMGEGRKYRERKREIDPEKCRERWRERERDRYIESAIVREAFRVTPSVTKVDSLLRATIFCHKNADFSESLNSFHYGAIFLPSLDQDLSRNTFVVSAYALKKNLSWRISLVMTPKF